MDLKPLIENGDQLFGKRSSLLSLWQDIGENFYPERSDFTVTRDLGDDFAGNLTSSYPIIVRRELGDAISSMLRPKGQQWGSISVDRDENLDTAGKQWLEQATKTQWRAMYDTMSGFSRATKQCDHDWAAFGQGVISLEMDWANTSLLYRNWHLRDVAWCEGYNGQISEVHRNWNPDVRTLAKYFKNSLHPNIAKLVTKEPYRIVKCRHVVIPVEYYTGEKKWRTPWVSLWIDLENKHLMKEEGSFSRIYCIPRWQTVSGSQYAYSPATVAGLPDARLIQAMTLTLLEAGEMAVRPPMVAVMEALRSDLQLFAGGVTAVDAAYDERLGEVLRPLNQDKQGLPFGMDVEADRRQILATAFYINKLNLPPADRDMTAYETGQRIQEYIRNALPLFEPTETEYNAVICEMTFEELFRVGAFGRIEDIPESVRGKNVRFKFESPLHQAVERQKGTKFIEAKQLIREAMELDPASGAILDARITLRDALDGIGVSPKWMRSEEAVEQHAQELAQQQQVQQALAAAQQGGEALEQVGKADQALAEVA